MSARQNGPSEFGKNEVSWSHLKGTYMNFIFAKDEVPKVKTGRVMANFIFDPILPVFESEIFIHA